MSDSEPAKLTTRLEVFNDTDTSIRMLCQAPAPLVINGGGYCGCFLLKGHEGKHRIEVAWS